MIAIKVGGNPVKLIEGGDAAHVVAGRAGQVQIGQQAVGVGDEQAGGLCRTMQSVLFTLSSKISNTPCRVDDAELLRLLELHLGGIKGSTDGQLLTRRVQVPLAAQATALLLRPGAVIGTGFLIRDAVVSTILEIVVHIAVQGARLAAPMVDVARQALRVVQPEAAAQGELSEVVPRLVGVSENLVAATGVHRLRQQAVASHFGHRAGQRQISLTGRALVRQLGEKLLGFRLRVITPAVFLEPVAGDVPAKRTGAAAMFQFQIAPPEAAAGDFDLAARMAKTTLGADGQSTAQRVQTKHRVGARHQVNTGNRRMRQQIPVHRIAERFVDAHAVKINRQTLCCTE